MSDDGERRADRTLAIAAEVSAILESLGIPSALIGAAALAVHGYPRATMDLNLAVSTDPFTSLREAATRIERQLGLPVAQTTPDAEDPLGGVLSVAGPEFELVQVVNFLNPLSGARNPGAEAVATAEERDLGGCRLRVVDLPHLVALKLYAGGRKSQLDVLELLERNASADREAIGRVCARFELDEEWRALCDEGLG